MAGAYYKRPQYTQNTVGETPEGTPSDPSPAPSSDGGFIRNFDRVQGMMHKNSVRKGFHEIDEDIANLTQVYGVPEALVQSIKEARIAQRLMLVVSELSEALEAVRQGNPPDSHIPEFSGLEAESADAVIRLMDLNETEAARLGKAIVAKAAYNANRPHKHGGKKF